jgi:hypothetical protein
MPVVQILCAEFVEHRLSTAAVDLIVQGSEVRTIAALHSANSECSVASLITSRRNNPSRFGEHYDVQEVANFECVDPLALDSELGLRDHCLQPPNAPLIATPVGFVSNEENAVLQMAVELADDLFAT